MRATELVALAKAHGFDLSGLVDSEPERTPGKRSQAFQEWLDGVEVVPPPGRSQPQPYRPSAAASIPVELPWLAAQWSFAGDALCYWPLWWALVFQGQRLGRRERWPPRVAAARGEPHFYVMELAELVLDEDAHRPLFVAAPALYALCLRVDVRTWDEVLAPRYRVLQAVYARWLAIARAEIQQRCRELTEDELDELSALMQEEEAPSAVRAAAPAEKFRGGEKAYNLAHRVHPAAASEPPPCVPAA
jgi:hypothetical protein